jgi:phosphate:Na+ symporter
MLVLHFVAFISLLGGVALFVLGIRTASDGLRRLAGDQMRRVIGTLTNNRVMGLIVGVAATLVFQSSTATTLLLVGFARAQLMSLTQAMGIILGADIGTTVTVQLVSFHVTDYALLLVTLGVVCSFFKQRRKLRSFGDVVLGFGLVFYSMALMIEGTRALRTSPTFTQLIETLAQHPALGLVAAAVFTSIVASSAATLGIILALAHAGAIDLHGALPMVFGANIGTTSTALLAAAGGGPTAKRVATAHLFFKVAGVAMALPFIGPFAQLCRETADTPMHQIANAHTIFNVGVGLLFLPITKVGAWFMYRLFRETAEERPFAPKYLDPRALGEPALAYSAAKQEVLRMADLVVGMMRNVMAPFVWKDQRAIELSESEDDKVDTLNREIKFYLAKVSQQEAGPGVAGAELNLVSVVTQLEFIGDVINKNIMELAQKFLRKNLVFSEQGAAEIQDLHAKVLENLELAVQALRHDDVEAAKKVLRHEAKIADIEKELVQSHLQRLHKGTLETFETSSIHLELLTSLRWINHYTAQMVESLSV